MLTFLISRSFPLSTMISVFYAAFLLVPVLADYDCVCNYNVEAGIYATAAEGQPIGYLYEFDCKPQAGPDSGDFYEIMNEKQKAYIKKNTQVQLQTCPGEIPDEDKLTTVAGMTTVPLTTAQTVTPKPTTTPQPTTIPTTMPTTRTTTPTTQTTTSTTQTTTPTTTLTDSTPSPSTTPAVTIPSTTQSGKVPEGHIEICPEYIRNTDVNRYGGFLGQYGEFCYELVNAPTQYANAERHCALVSSGHLVHVLNQNEQDFIVRFLSKHHYVQSVWLGLTDSGNANEGTWRWNSGAPFKYNNFQGDYTQHSSHTHTLNDCVVLKQGGEWTDVPCGIAFFLGLGSGEKHPYICQYNVSSSLPSIVQAFPDVVVG